MHQEPISSMIRKYLWQALKHFFFFSTLRRWKHLISPTRHHWRSAGGPGLLTASARWLPRQHFPKNVPLILKTFSFLHYPLLSKLCSYYPRCLMGTTRFVYTLWGLWTSGMETCVHTDRHTHTDTHTKGKKETDLVWLITSEKLINDCENWKQKTFKLNLDVNKEDNILMFSAEYIQNYRSWPLPFSWLCRTALCSPRVEAQGVKKSGLS